jgi:dihydroneopterin aldolase
MSTKAKMMQGGIEQNICDVVRRDKVLIEELEVYAYHGVATEEKKIGQMFVVSLQVMVELEKAAKNDNLSYAVNYSELCNDIENVLTESKYNLIESAALAIIERILKKYKEIYSAKVLIKKPWAPLGRHLKYVAVEIERERND